MCNYDENDEVCSEADRHIYSNLFTCHKLSAVKIKENHNLTRTKAAQIVFHLKYTKVFCTYILC